MDFERLVAWVVRSFLVLFIVVNAYGWLDILVLQREEYERLVGSESACGIAEAYCSWAAFIWRGAPFDALAVLKYGPRTTLSPGIRSKQLLATWK